MLFSLRSLRSLRESKIRGYGSSWLQAHQMLVNREPAKIEKAVKESIGVL